jgi:hypothetical protein
LDDVITETIDSSPHDPEAYPPGSGVNVTVQFDGRGHRFSRLSAGYESVEEVWMTGYRMRLGRVESKPVLVEVFLDRVDPGTPRTFTVKKGETLSLDEKTQLRFDSHSHKRTQTGGPASPLMVNLVFLEGQSPVEAKTFYLHLDESRKFTWRQFTFELVKHEYNRFMELKMDPGKLVPMKSDGMADESPAP